MYLHPLQGASWIVGGDVQPKSKKGTRDRQGCGSRAMAGAALGLGVGVGQRLALGLEGGAIRDFPL